MYHVIILHTTTMLRVQVVMEVLKDDDADQMLRAMTKQCREAPQNVCGNLRGSFTDVELQVLFAPPTTRCLFSDWLISVVNKQTAIMVCGVFSIYRGAVWCIILCLSYSLVDDLACVY